MNILVLNGSPKGKNSITLQTVLYLQKLHPAHTFEILHVGQRIRQYETDFTPARQAIARAQLLLFAYPVYTFLLPYQLQRFLELMRENQVETAGKFASQISTSKHFYDVTAHAFLEENCRDLGLRTIRGLSADMDDLLTAQGQAQAESYFDQLLFDIENGICPAPSQIRPQKAKPVYTPSLPAAPKAEGRKVVVVTSCADEDDNLRNMIADFKSALPHPVQEVNLRKYPFAGGCLGCMSCAVTGACVYKDGFDAYLRTQIQTADAIVYAFTIENHYAHSSFKCYDDRQFCNGHRAVTVGMPVGYLLSGDYRREANLQLVVQGRSEVGGVYLCGVATDEDDTAKAIGDLAKSLCYALEKKPTRPQNFYGVGGTKIFRDLIYLMQGLMKADHKFYKAHGVYDFPQKHRGRILQMKLIGALMARPAVQKKMKGKMTDFIVSPYQKIIDRTTPR